MTRAAAAHECSFWGNV